MSQKKRERERERENWAWRCQKHWALVLVLPSANGTSLVIPFKQPFRVCGAHVREWSHQFPRRWA